MKASYKFALRVWAYYGITLVLCLFFIAMGSGDIWATLLNIALLAGMLALTLNEGGYRGEKACTLAVSLEKQEKEGRAADPEQKKEIFHPSVALKMFIIVLVPFLLIAGLNIIVNPPRPGIPAIPPAVEEESAIVDQQPIGPVVMPEEDFGEPRSAFAMITRSATWITFMPFIFAYFHLSEVSLFWLFFAFGIPFPLAGAIGYMMGPRLRERKLAAMMKGKRRKMRNLKVNQKPRGPKPVI